VSLLAQRTELARSLRALRHHPPRVVLRDAVGHAVLQAGGASLRTRIPPSLREIQDAGGTVHVEAGRAARALCPSASDDELDALRAEHDEVRAALHDRHATLRLAFPAVWAADEGTSLFIYLLARLRRPATILETGVANGYSSFVWLSALRRNGAGRLHSVDVRQDAGPLVDDELRRRWERHVLDAARLERHFAALVSKVGPIDLFFHGAGHGYLAQRFEYESAWSAMTPGGLLVSDDVQESRAFVEFAERCELRPHVLVDTRRIIGAAVIR
jgi:predicted O-methyltransferase YrrM